MAQTRIKELWKSLTLSEVSGSLGDLGTFIPLTVALARARKIYLAPALFFSGISSIITGYMWDVPMCVQPMKSISAVALSSTIDGEQILSRGAVTCAGILTGAMVLVLGLTNAIELVNKIVPITVVSGLQIGLGLKLVIKGIREIEGLQSWFGNVDCIALGLVLGICVLYWLREPRQRQPTNATNENDDDHNNETVGTAIPLNNLSEESTNECSLQQECYREVGVVQKWIMYCFRRRRSNSLNDASADERRKAPVGVYLFVVGAILAGFELASTNNTDDEYDLPLRLFGAPVAVWAFEDVEENDWKTAFFEGALPQMPLTTLNSVISVCALAHSLYPEKRTNKDSTSGLIRETDAVVTRKEVAVSVGLMNLLTCPFGCIPNCHGAGGLAGQHRLGARSGSSLVFLGLCKVFLAIFFGASALTLLDALPTAVLGLMLAIAGQELTTTGLTLLVKKSSDGTLKTDLVIAIVTASVILAVGKTHYGAMAGWLTWIIYGDGFEIFKNWIRREGRSARSPQAQAVSLRNGYQESKDVSLSSSDGSATSNNSDNEDDAHLSPKIG